MTMIQIKRSETADTRTCDWKRVTKEQLLKSSKQHIGDVSRGIGFFIDKLKIAAENHDHTKISGIDSFHSDFTTGFESTEWWKMHQREERHHIRNNEPENINLIDVIEHIADCVMAGMARSGEFRFEGVDEEQLARAFNNTVNLLLENVEVDDSE